MAASLDDLVPDKSNDNISKIGLIEIKSPKSKKSSKINDLVHDKSFYIKYEDRVPGIKKKIFQSATIQNTNGSETLSNKIV